MYIENFKNIIFQSKRILILRMIGLALFVQVILSFNLWFDSHVNFPKVPLFDFALFENILFSKITSLLFLFSIISQIFVTKSNQKMAVIFFLFISLLLFLQDLNRIQVWMYFYIIIFLNILFTEKDNEAQFLINLRIIVGSVYFWSGLYKLNIHYVETFQWLVSEIKIFNSIHYIEIVAFISALIELSLGILMVINKVKKVVFFSIFFMHCFIIFNLYLLDWNAIVFPWNILMIVLVYYSLYASSNTSISFNIRQNFYVLTICTIPVLYFFNIIPSVFSFCMYSGRESSATLAFNSKVSKLKILESAIDNQEIIGVDLDYWSAIDKNVPIFADDFYFRKMNKTLCQKYSELGYLGLIINKNPIQNKQYKIKCPCEKI